MFGRENWARRAAELDSTDPKKQKKFEDKRTILESMRHHRGRTLVGSLVLSTLLNLGSLGKLGSLEGDWVKDRYSKRVKIDGKNESDPLIKIEDAKNVKDKEKSPEKYNEFTSVEDAEKNLDALIKVDRDDPLAGLEDLSLEDRARVDIATFDLRREYHKGDLKLEDLEDREKMFDELVHWYIENSSKDEDRGIDFSKLLGNLKNPSLPLVEKSRYDENASRMSQILKKEDSRGDCEAYSLFQISVLQRVFNYDPSLKNYFEIYKASRSAYENGDGHSFVLILIKDTGVWMKLQRTSLKIFDEEDKKYTAAYPVSSLVSGAIEESEKEVLHKFDKDYVENEGDPELKEKNKNESKVPENAITREIVNIHLPTFPSNIPNPPEVINDKRKDENSELSEVVKKALSPEVILQPKVEKFLKQISKLKTGLTNATNDEVRTSLESDIYEVVVSSDPDVLEKAVEKDPYIMIVYLQRELKIVSSAYNITLKQKISQDTPNIELEERPKGIAIPERKENESDKSFEKRLSSYFQLLNDQMKLYFIRAKSELSTEIEKDNIIIDDLEDFSKYPDLLKTLQRYEKNGTLDILTFWVDQFPDYIKDIRKILEAYHIFALEDFVKNWGENASLDDGGIEDLYLKQQELADIYLEKNRIDDAQKIYEELIKNGYNSLGEISYSLAHCYFAKDAAKLTVNEFLMSAMLGNIKAKDVLKSFYLSGIEHELVLQSFEKLLQHEKTKFEDPNNSLPLENKNKLVKSYLSTLSILDREIPDDVVEVVEDINVRATHKELLDIVIDTSGLLGRIYFGQKKYFKSIDNYKVAAELEQGERIDSHLFEICDNVDKKFREVDVAYAKSTLGSLSRYIAYKLEGNNTNKELTNDQKFKIVKKYFNVWKHISDVEFPDERFVNALFFVFAHDDIYNNKKNHDLLDYMVSFMKDKVVKLIDKEGKDRLDESSGGRRPSFSQFGKMVHELKNAVYKPDEEIDK